MIQEQQQQINQWVLTQVQFNLVYTNNYADNKPKKIYQHFLTDLAFLKTVPVLVVLVKVPVLVNCLLSPL